MQPFSGPLTGSKSPSRHGLGCGTDEACPVILAAFDSPICLGFGLSFSRFLSLLFQYCFFSRCRSTYAVLFEKTPPSTEQVYSQTCSLSFGGSVCRLLESHLKFSLGLFVWLGGTLFSLGLCSSRCFFFSSLCSEPPALLSALSGNRCALLCSRRTADRFGF